MKQIPSAVLLLLAGALAGPVSGGVADETVMPFFQALRAGDVQALKRYVGGALYDDISPLLEDNAAYPAYLRRHYRGAQARIDGVTPTADGKRVDLTIRFPDGSEHAMRLRLTRDAADDWRIVEQRER